jgi:hypothetical protein
MAIHAFFVYRFKIILCVYKSHDVGRTVHPLQITVFAMIRAIHHLRGVIKMGVAVMVAHLGAGEKK